LARAINRLGVIRDQIWLASNAHATFRPAYACMHSLMTGNSWRVHPSTTHTHQLSSFSTPIIARRTV
jgi:hypothetical protein